VVPAACLCTVVADNVEWFLGMQPKFGLYRVDTETLKRSPKFSTRWFREMATRNAVV
jgi:beta-glucosidase